MLEELALSASPLSPEDELQLGEPSFKPHLSRVESILEKDLDSKYQFEQKLPFHPNSGFIRVYVTLTITLNLNLNLNLINLNLNLKHKP